MKQEIFAGFAAPDQASVLGRIMAESFRTAFADFISRETLDRCAVAENCAELLRSLMEAGEMTVLVGYVNREPMGLLVYSLDPAGHMEIEAIHSLPRSWGTGLGAAMLALARQDHRGGAGLWAFAQNARARRFYEKQGFHFTGETRISEFDGAEEVRYEVNWDE